MTSPTSNPRCRSRTEIERLLLARSCAGAHGSTAAGLAVCMIKGEVNGADAAIRAFSRPSMMVAEDGPGSWCILMQTRSTTEAWLTCGRMHAELSRLDAGGAAPAMGLSCSGEGAEVLDRADAAAELAVARGAEGGDFCTWEMVALDRAARAVRTEGHACPETARMRLLRRIAWGLGPAQSEHITSHCEEVGRAAARLAQLMRLPAPTVEAARLTGLMHDIGKAAFPEEMLAKRQGLSPGDRGILQRHADEGAAVCAALGLDRDICRAVGQHHRRFDDAAAALHEQPARIVCVADALTTMTSTRSYSAARTFSEALTELRRGRGTLFDPDVVVAAHLLGAAAMSHLSLRAA